jgi:hypothetical protein
MVRVECSICHAVFSLQPYRLALGKGRYCSRACANAGRTLKAHERFWRNVKKTRTCWLWIGTADKGSYGHIGTGGRKGIALKPHRLSWAIHHGPVPPGFHVLHRCDVRSCVRPSHLFLGTHADNMADKTAKNRQRKGAMVPSARLTARAVRFIRKRHANGWSNVRLAEHYHVNRSTISLIVNHLRWKHV